MHRTPRHSRFFLNLVELTHIYSLTILLPPLDLFPSVTVIEINVNLSISITHIIFPSIPKTIFAVSAMRVRRATGADRREHGQDSGGHDGRRKGVERHGKMLRNLRVTVEKVSYLGYAVYVDVKLGLNQNKTRSMLPAWYLWLAND